jgi:hypothetical protein
MNSGQREGQGQGQIQIQNDQVDEHLSQVQANPEEILAIENRQQGMDIRKKIQEVRKGKKAYELNNRLNSELPTAREASLNGGSRKKQSHKNYRKKSHKKKYTRNFKQTRKQRRRKTKSKK